MSKVSRMFKTPLSLFKRHTSQKPDNPKDWRYRMRRLAFDISVYKKYGLYTDDLQDDDSPIVREALRRLPKEVLDGRHFRQIRAIHLNFLKTYLPVEKWVTYEQDLNYRYMRPYLEEIRRERQEIFDFGCPNYSQSDWPADEVK